MGTSVFISDGKFLGPRGPLRTPLMSVVVRRPQQKFQTLSYLFSFNSDSKLTQPLPQYTVHRTLNMNIEH